MPPAFHLPAVTDTPVLATAIHAGHDVRPEVADHLALDEGTRLREEDPATDFIAAGVAPPLVVHRSRFEVDLNRPREDAVYRSPEQSWGLEVWDGEIPEPVALGSLDLYDEFYRYLTERLDLLAERGPFVVFDVHSYNHRRDGAEAAAAPAEENPDVNVGTGSLDHHRWGEVVEALVTAMGGVAVRGEPLDVRENVRFEGGHLARWVHARYPESGCTLALEFKKTFMDEWTGQLDDHRLVALQEALGGTVPAVLDALDLAPS